MTEQPTIQDVIEILTKMHGRFDAMDSRFDAMEARLTRKIDRLDAKIDLFKNELKEEISGSYAIHESRITRPEVAVGE